MRRLMATCGALAVASICVVVLTGAGPVASGNNGHERHGHGADIAALHELQASFHEAVSGGGNIDLLASLWAEDATFTAGGRTIEGRDAIRAFFLQSGGFTHNWVSLAPSWKTRIEVSGKTAHVYFECHFVDWRAVPMVVTSDGSFEGTAKKVHGQWYFWHVTAGVAPLTP